MFRVIFLILCFVLFGLTKEPVHVDGVLAVVGSEVILKSSVLGQAELIAKERGVSPQNQPFLFQQIFEKSLQEQIHRQIVLHSAKKDTSINVSFDDINNELENRISHFVSSFGSEEALEEAMGMKIKHIKEEYWEVVEEELLVDRFRFLLFGDVSISRQEVASFFSENKDSFPPSPSLISCSVFGATTQPSLKTKDSIFSFVETVRDSIVRGLISFELAARTYSKDPGSAKLGGDLGFSKRGAFLPAYEKTAFDLVLGDISPPIETRFGLHLIYLLDRVGEKVHTKHILFTLDQSNKDKEKAKKSVSDIFGLVKNDPGLFDSLALVSHRNSEGLSGVYVDYDKSLFPPPFIEQLNLVEPYSYSSVFNFSNSFYLVYKYQEAGGDLVSLQNNWGMIESAALQEKLSRLFALWIEGQLSFVYVKVFGL